MTRFPLVLRGRVFQDDESGSWDVGDVGVDPETGKILAVGRSLEGEEVHDHGDGLIVPAATDVHVHLRDPGAPHKEDFESGTRAALAGGVTTVFDMPNTDPPTLTKARYEEKREIAAGRAVADWGLWGGTVGEVEDTVALCRDAPGIKVYLGESTGDVTMRDGGSLTRLFARLVEEGYGGVVAFHAESQQVLERAKREHAGEPGLQGHEARRPAVAEAEAFRQIQDALQEAAGSAPVPFRVHLAHVSTLGLLQAAQEAGVSLGVTPHHLLLHLEMPLGGFGRVNPPLRAPPEQQGLWRAFAEGRVPIVESDHAPHTREEKERDVQEAPSGMPGVESMVPVLLAHALEPPAGAPAVSVARVVRATADAPARLMGLEKGQIRLGYDADLAVYHRSDIAPLDPARRVTRCGWSPFEGAPAVFPRSVYRRGEQVVEMGKVTASRGSGRPVHPGARRPGGSGQSGRSEWR